MNADNNRLIFAKNLNYYLSKANKNQNDLVRDLGITASTVSDWANGKKYPRVDKMQLLADYFGVLKSDLTEDRLNCDEIRTQNEFHVNDHEKKVIIAYRKRPDMQNAVDTLLGVPIEDQKEKRA